MDTTSCTTIVLVLLWLYMCCNALGSLVAPIHGHSTSEIVYATTTLSTVLLGICLWQCKKAGYLVSPMTRYHWVLLVLLVLLQVLTTILVVSEKFDWGITQFFSFESSHIIYGTSVVLAVILVLLGGTLFCGWKCNLFCRPCCKSQYICYGSAIVVVLVILAGLAVTASMVRFLNSDRDSGEFKGNTEIWTIDYFCRALIPITHCYVIAVLWNTTLRLPYTVPEVVALIASAVAAASLLALAVLGGTHLGGVKLKATAYSFLALHLVTLAIALYCLEYKATFCCSKQYLCFGILSMVLVIALVEVSIANVDEYGKKIGIHKYILIGYSFLLMVPTLWYAYRCGLLTWRWNSCVPKKKGLNGTDTAENTIPDSDIAKLS